MRSIITLTAAIVLAASPCGAETAAQHSPPAAQISPKAGKAKAAPNFDAIAKIFDQLFPQQPDPDPARFALARTSVASVWPDGAYSALMTNFAGGMFDRVLPMKKSDLAPIGGKVAPPRSSAANLSLHDEAAAKDPYFDQRVAAIRAAVADDVEKASAIIDPRIRDGMARAMARRFDARQLTDVNAFFATPSGHAFAGQYMQLWVDPDMMHSMMSSLPEMVKLMPDMMQKIKAANDRFPKPPSTPSKPAKS